MSRRSLSFLITLLLPLALSSPFFSQSDQNKAEETRRVPLKGLSGFHVVVEQIDRTEIDQGYLSEEAIKTDVELRLRKANIRVLSESDWISDSRSPYLYVKVSIMRAGDLQSWQGLYAYHISVSVEQAVLLKESFGKEVMANTWKAEASGTVGRSNVSSIRVGVDDYVDKLINDYLAANPRSESQASLSLPPVWKSLDNARLKSVTVFGDSIVITSNLTDAEQDAGCFVLANLQKKGQAYSGIENYECICTRRDPRHVGTVRRFQLVSQMELSLVTPSRIEGRIMREPEGAKFNCAEGKYDKPPSWLSFVLIPN